MTIEGWAKDFKSYVNELQMLRDDYKGIMLYIDDAITLLKEQQKKKIELLGKFDKEIEEAREAVEDCACDGDHSGVVYFQHKQHDFQYAKAIIENVL